MKAKCHPAQHKATEEAIQGIMATECATTSRAGLWYLDVNINEYSEGTLSEQKQIFLQKIHDLVDSWKTRVQKQKKIIS